MVPSTVKYGIIRMLDIWGVLGFFQVVSFFYMKPLVNYVCYFDAVLSLHYFLFVISINILYLVNK